MLHCPCIYNTHRSTKKETFLLSIRFLEIEIEHGMLICHNFPLWFWFGFFCWVPWLDQCFPLRFPNSPGISSVYSFIGSLSSEGIPSQNCLPFCTFPSDAVRCVPIPVLVFSGFLKFTELRFPSPMHFLFQPHTVISSHLFCWWIKEAGKSESVIVLTGIFQLRNQSTKIFLHQLSLSSLSLPLYSLINVGRETGRPPFVFLSRKNVLING